MHQAVFRAIADPTRRAIIEKLAGQEMTVNEIAGHFDVSRPAISKHLKVMEEGGLLHVRQLGRERYNSLNATGLRNVYDWIDIFSQYWDDKLFKLKQEVEREHG